MPTLAMEAWEKLDNQPWEIDEDGTQYKGGNVVDTFMELLDQAIYDARDMLLERFEWICS